MAGLRYHLKRYYEISQKEWFALLTTAAVAGFALSYNDWGGAAFDFAVGLKNLAVAVGLVLVLLWVHVAISKAVGVFFGVRVTYDKYGLGLLIGLLVTFLTFGLWPVWVNGQNRYLAIPNLRIGKFRGTIAKDWEIALICGAAVLANLFVTIPLGLLFEWTGVAFFWSAVKVSLLIAIYAMIPLPLIQSSNPYQIYMSRVEALEGSLTGYDIFWGARAYYVMLLAIVAGFSVFIFAFGSTLWTVLLSLLLGFAGLYAWHVVQKIQRI